VGRCEAGGVVADEWAPDAVVYRPIFLRSSDARPDTSSATLPREILNQRLDLHRFRSVVVNGALVSLGDVLLLVTPRSAITTGLPTPSCSNRAVIDGIFDGVCSRRHFGGLRT
jgi:hypothetical protein